MKLNKYIGISLGLLAITSGMIYQFAVTPIKNMFKEELDFDFGNDPYDPMGSLDEDAQH